MYQTPDYTNVSVALSEVLAELGLNKLIVNKRRRACLVMELVSTVSERIRDRLSSPLIFGSRSEGTTTRELNSDTDYVMWFDDPYVIEEWRHWKFGVENLLIVEAEDTTPGYCMLQVLSPNAPLPETEVISEHWFRDRQGRIFLKTTIFMNVRPAEREQHGPAFADQVHPEVPQTDLVPALTCRFQLPVVQHWLSQLRRPWPRDDMKRYIASCPSFLVAVGGKGSANETFEWRISTSLAERCLMFNLNITQLQVYVLMKMLLKTSINFNVPEESHISSFICKTVLLHCVQNTEHNVWQSRTLIQCLLFSLVTLYVCVVNENCPHFIIRSNNLMAGRITQQAKYQLQENLQWLFVDIVSRGILSLHNDDVASRLMHKLNPLLFRMGRCANDKECQIIYSSLLLDIAVAFQNNVKGVLLDLTENRRSGPILLLLQYFQRLQHIFNDGNPIERIASMYFAPYICTTVGSVLTSETIQTSNILSHQALAFFSLGLDTDVSSSRLKLASLFFCKGDIEKAAVVLRDLEGRYDINVCEIVCVCTNYARIFVMTRREALALASDDDDVSKTVSTCVIFIHAEKNCIPEELHYEMYRSTQEDLQHRTVHDYWMDWAVVDSLPYLHFLSYKVYGRLQSRADQQRALYNLELSIQAEPNLGHRETALNLLGQCMEQENRWNDALQCYIRSLQIRPRNNAANLHVCKLLYMRLRQT